MAIWVNRAGKLGEFENKFIESKRIYCTWDNLPVSIMSFATKQDIQQYFVDSDPEVKVKTAMNWASQVWPFAHEMKTGEIVALPSKIHSTIHFGRIKGDYVYDESAPVVYRHYRPVEWFAMDVPRSCFDQDILFSFGASLTIFRVQQEDRILEVLKMKPKHPPKGDDTGCDPDGGLESRDIEADALDTIMNLLIQKTKGHGLEKIVNGILKAKGFTTYLSPIGADKGVDILASSGLLGFGSPKICVQVKSSDAPVDRPALDQLGGVMRNMNAEFGLLVSWSGFKSSVTNETAKQFFNIRLWTNKEILEEFLRYYDQMDDDIQELIPLKKIWVVSQPAE